MKSGTWKLSPKRSRVPFTSNDYCDWSDDNDEDYDTDNERMSPEIVTIVNNEEELQDVLEMKYDNVSDNMKCHELSETNCNYVGEESTSDTSEKMSSCDDSTSKLLTLDQRLGLRQRRLAASESDILSISTDRSFYDSTKEGMTVDESDNLKNVNNGKSENDAKSTSCTNVIKDDNFSSDNKSRDTPQSRKLVSKTDATPARTPPATPMNQAILKKRIPLTRGISRQQSMTASNRLRVGVKMKVKMEYIDDVSHEMNALVYLSLHYEDLAASKFITNQPGFCVLDPEKEGIHVPVVNFLNTKMCDHVEGFKVLVNTISGTVFIYRIYRVVFRNIMNLKRFPFDRQVMKCHIKSFTAIFEPWSAPVATMPSGITSDEMWRDNDCVVECDCTLWNVSWVRSSTDMRSQPSVYKMNFGISRISLFYIVNFFLITFLVVVATISCTIINFTDFASRSSITFTILLTIISLKFIISNYTPTINYLTLLDYYNIIGTVAVILVILQNYVVAHYPDDAEFAGRMDYYLYYYFGCSWVVMHLFLFIGSYTDIFYEDWDNVMSSDDMLSDLQRVHNKHVDCT